MYFFLLYVCLCIFSEYVFTLYSKQINNYKLILLACECVCFFVVHWQFCSFFLKRPQSGSYRTGGVQNWFSTSVCEWSVCVFYFSTTFLLGNWYRSTAVETIFCLFLPFRTKIEHLKLLHCCIVCFSQ